MINYKPLQEELTKIKIEHEKEIRNLEEKIRTLKFEKETIETYMDERIKELEDINTKLRNQKENKCNCTECECEDKENSTRKVIVWVFN